MPKGSTFANDLLALIFNAISVPNLARDTATSPATGLVIALHTGDPGVGGLQTTNEISYTGYGRVTVNRDPTIGWVVSGGVVHPIANLDFGTMTAGAGGIVTHFSIGTNPSTTPNKILYSGTVVPNIDVTVGTLPRLTTATSITEV